jgi:hypothetical protein
LMAWNKPRYQSRNRKIAEKAAQERGE